MQSWLYHAGVCVRDCPPLKPRPSTQNSHHTHAQEGLVVATHGRHVVVESPAGERRICHPRGKKNAAVVGDRVWWLASEDEGTIEAVQPRRNLMYRQDEVRTKSFAANLDQVLVLLGAEPEFSERQLARALISAEAEHINPLIVLNKSDLGPLFERAWSRLEPYRQMGYRVLPLSLRTDLPYADQRQQAIDALDEHLRQCITLVLGPSGAGKSTLINHWVPAALVQTNDISRALNSGKHTTTSTHLYWVDTAKTTALIDSPGFQEFGLHHIEPMHLAQLMPDLRHHLGKCKFANCTHLHEPGCSIISHMKTADSTSPISETRYQIYGELFAELSAIQHW